MKIVFVSNFYNHHQAPLSNVLFNELKGEYFFICTSTMPEERLSLGYQVLGAPFVLNYDNDKDKCMYEINSADVVIIGSAPYALVKERLKKGRLVFFYSERLYKNRCVKGFEILLRMLKYYYKYDRFDNSYLLCASAFTGYDYSKTHTFKNRMFKWGYFPETKKYNLNNLFELKNPKKILWVGRLIDWKHPDDVIRIAKMLKESGYSFEIDIVGSGIMDQKIRQAISSSNLDDCVHCLGPVPSSMVRKYMEKAGIFMFTSDRNEGWGAVLNESMNSACSVIASDAIGAVPFLLKNRENGLIFHSGDINQLYESVKSLLDDHKLQRFLGMAAYKTIVNEWNAEVAAKRFISLSSTMNNKLDSDLFVDGPCSKSSIIKDDWFSILEASV